MSIPAFDPRPGPILNVASGLLLVALGLFVAAVRPRRRANLAFAGFAAGWGVSTIADWIVEANPGVLVVPPDSALLLAAEVTQLLFLGVAAACLPLVALWFPARLAERERSYARWAALAAGGFAVAAAVLWVSGEDGLPSEFEALGLPAGTAYAVVGTAVAKSILMHAASLFALVLLALRARLAQRESRDAERRQYVLMTVALLLNGGIPVGIRVALADVSRSGSAAVDVLSFITLAALAALWLSGTRGAPGSATRAARDVALLTVALPFIGWALITSSLTILPTHAPPGVGGLARTLTVLVLAYAVVRHQILGIDVKVRWTLSKSTVAAAFVAAFFVASEGAQILLGQGNEWVGLLGAGALVFALAPLQRAAERLAERAVPAPTREPPATTDSRPGATSGEAAYRRALRLALRERAPTRDEERELVLLAHELGLTPDRAFALRDEAERAVLEASGKVER